MNANVVSLVGDYSDIDTRRALGIPPKRLPPSNFNPRPIPRISWRYWPERGVAIFFQARPDRSYEFEVHTHLYYDEEVQLWYYVPGARVSATRANRLRSRFTFSEFCPAWLMNPQDQPGFMFGQQPEFITQEP